jgi:uncharacterized protein YndB with AHSA1/START domain
MEFVVDRDAKTVSITKEFAARLELVWDAYTKAELLDQWWAPKPFESRTKVLDFEVGGRRFYAMVGPDGAERWAVQKYTSITPKTNFKFFNAFADADENLQLPGSDWNFDFIDQGETTIVSVSIYNESLERMEMILASGFTEGVKLQIQNLVELLAELKKP